MPRAGERARGDDMASKKERGCANGDTNKDGLKFLDNILRIGAVFDRIKGSGSD